MPSAASASFRPVSSVAIDFTLTTSVGAGRWTSAATMALASAASSAQCTWPPARVTLSSSRSR